jgi:plasmid stabilization system protein ParE
VVAGGRWFARLLSALDTLELRPDRCPLAAESDELSADVRELLLGRGRFKYRLLFRIQGSTVQILRVWHGSRDAITEDDL